MSVLDHVEEIERLLGVASKTVYRTTDASPVHLLHRAFFHATRHNLTEASKLVNVAKRIMFIDT